MADDSREDLESESKFLTKSNEKLIGEAKSIKSDVNDVENIGMKELETRQKPVAASENIVAASLVSFDTIQKALSTAKNQAEFEKKKGGFQGDLKVAEKTLNDLPNLIDELEASFNDYNSTAIGRLKDAENLQLHFKQLAGESEKLNARIKSYNESLAAKVNGKLPLLNILSSNSDLDSVPNQVKPIMKTLSQYASDIEDSRNDLKKNQKVLKETLAAKIEKLKFGAKAGKK
jgi:chromosome segregation ATPase